MRYAILGYPDDDPVLDLDYREFSYAGKFVMSSTGKSVAREGEDVIGAVAFSPDHDDPQTCRLRYVTVRTDRQNEGIGSRLLRFTAAKLQKDSFESIEIAVNNPVAYRACYRAGFTYTGSNTGIAELLLGYTPCRDRSTTRYREGLAVFEDRDLPPVQREVLQRQDLPSVISSPITDFEHD